MRTATQYEACAIDRRWERCGTSLDAFNKEWNSQLEPLPPYWKKEWRAVDGERIIDYFYLFSDGQHERWTCLNTWPEGACT